ncbi:MAG TPA: hypothetical protein DEB40_10860 [Elusimicrobia bacterium]|nr:hypothetical protein [Elusimicrobiota bacterium]HBT62230.1 hypothetical protein [Elusimicrobiota bacterium]
MLMSSIRWRFAFTIGSNLIRGSISFITGILLARYLGPASYGNMAFLLGTFLGIRQLLDMGSSSAFFTFLSQKPRSRRFVMSYFAWLAAQFLITLGVIGLLFPSRWIATIWHGEQRGLVLLAFTAAFMQNSIWPVIQQAGESQRQTVWVQGISTVVAGVHLSVVILLRKFGILQLYAIFAAISLEYFLAAVVAQKWHNYAKEETSGSPHITSEPLFGKYLNYCSPLILYSCIGFAYNFADRWLLQKYGGDVEQAYYAVGSQFSAIALIATSSILRIFWKEIAEAHHLADHARTKTLYQKVSRHLFFGGAMIAGFFMPWAEDLLRLVLGASYVGGTTTMAIMFLYPVHQSMGQIVSTMLFATERVSLQVTTGIIFMIASMGATYLVLAPGNAVIPGLGLASMGLAIKMIMLQLIQVNVLAYMIARIWKWPFDWVHQPASLLGCLGSGWIAHAAAMRMDIGATSLPGLMGLGGGIYLLMMATFVCAMPWLAGLTRDDLISNVTNIWGKAGCRWKMGWSNTPDSK